LTSKNERGDQQQKEVHPGLKFVTHGSEHGKYDSPGEQIASQDLPQGLFFWRQLKKRLFVVFVYKGLFAAGAGEYRGTQGHIAFKFVVIAVAAMGTKFVDVSHKLNLLLSIITQKREQQQKERKDLLVKDNFVCSREKKKTPPVNLEEEKPKEGQTASLYNLEERTLSAEDLLEEAERRHEEARQSLNAFRQNFSDGEYMSQRDLLDYRRNIENYANTGNRLRQLYKEQGRPMKQDEENQWQEQLRMLSESYDEATSFYGQFQNAEDYNEQLLNMKQTEKMLTEDTQALQKEVEELQSLEQNYALNEQQLREYLLNPGIQNISEHQADAITQWMDEMQYQYGFSNVDELNAYIGKKRNYLAQVKRLQERTELEAVADPNSDRYDPEFAQYSGYKSTKVAQWENGYFDTWNPDFYGSQQSGELNSGYADTVYEYINGNTDVSAYLAGVENNYGYLEEREKEVYNYYYSKYGRLAAEEYLYKLEELLNLRAAKASFERLQGKTGQELMFAAAAGLDQFAYGLESLGNTEGEYKAPSKNQYLSQMVREDLQDDTLPVWYNFKSGQWESTVLGNSVGQIAYDMISTTANMAPAMAASAAVGAVSKTGGMLVSSMLLGTSAGGNAYQEKINSGYTQEEAATFGLLVGLSETALEMAASGAGKIAKGALQYLDDVGVVLEKLAESAGGKILLNAGQEAAEEGLQTVLEPYMWEAVSGEKMTVEKQEVLYNSLLGCITGGLTESSAAAVSRGANLATGKTSLSKEGLGLPPNEQRLFDKYQKQLDQYSRTESLLEKEKAKLQQEMKGVNEIQQGITRLNIKRLEKLLEQKARKLDATESNPVLKNILDKMSEDKKGTAQTPDTATQTRQNAGQSLQPDMPNTPDATAQVANPAQTDTAFRQQTAENAQQQAGTQPELAGQVATPAQQDLTTQPEQPDFTAQTTTLAQQDNTLQTPTTDPNTEFEDNSFSGVEKSRENNLDNSSQGDILSVERLDNSRIEENEVEASRKKRVDTMNQNRRKGRNAERLLETVFDHILKDLRTQITIQIEGTKVRFRADAIGYELTEDGEKRLKILEFKSSKKARLTKNQKKAFELLKSKNGIVVGRNKKGMLYSRGFVIPAGTQIEVIKLDEGGEWYVSDRYGQG